MSIINLDQFAELSEDYPELAMCYDLDSTFTKDAATEELVGDTCAD